MTRTKSALMKAKLLIVVVALVASACASEIDISASDVPQPVMAAFNEKYAGANNVTWEVEKNDGKLYYEAEFTIEGKKKEAYFRPDGTFAKEE